MKTKRFSERTLLFGKMLATVNIQQPVPQLKLIQQIKLKKKLQQIFEVTLSQKIRLLVFI